MNKVLCGFVCLLLCLLLYSACVVPRGPQVTERAAAARDEQFGPVPETIVLRILAKELLLEDLASGRLTLFAAAALFRELDRMPPVAVYPPIGLECPTEDELYCMRVITFARYGLKAAQPARAEIVTERLVDELESQRCLSGTIRLPDPGSLEPVHELLQRCVHRGLSAPTTNAPGENP
jgi:hypothetical protein